MRSPFPSTLVTVGGHGGQFRLEDTFAVAETLLTAHAGQRWRLKLLPESLNTRRARTQKENREVRGFYGGVDEFGN